MLDYWQKQTTKPLITDLSWSKPESHQTSGTVGLIGGSKTNFLALSNAYQLLQEQQINLKLVAPDSLKKTLFDIDQVEFAPSNQSGSIGKDGHKTMLKLANDSDTTLLIGDAGKNSQTEVEYQLLVQKANQNQLVIARDAVDLICPIINDIIDRPNLVLLVSFSQLQNIFRTLYYPILLTHSAQMIRMVEILHKFSLTYDSTIVLFWQNQLFVAYNGQIITSDKIAPSSIWQGTLAAQITAWVNWFPDQKLAAISNAIADFDQK